MLIKWLASLFAVSLICPAFASPPDGEVNAMSACLLAMRAERFVGETRPTVDLELARLGDEILPGLEERALRAKKNFAGSRGDACVHFYQLMDQGLRNDGRIPGALLKLARRRLPYLADGKFVLFLSGGVAEAWLPAILSRAAKDRLQPIVVQLPGCLSFARGGARKNIPEFSQELVNLLRVMPAIFFDDSYSNGGTAMAVRGAVARAGGNLEGVFVAYDGGKGDVSALYKTGLETRREPSPGNFSATPLEWNWANDPRRIAIEGPTTLWRDDGALTAQGSNLLTALDHLQAQTQILMNDRPIAPPTNLRRWFPHIHWLATTDAAELRIGHWQRSFVGFSGLAKSHNQARIETPAIGPFFKEGVLTEELLDPRYFINRMVEHGILQPVFTHGRSASLEISSPAVIDLRSGVSCHR